MSELSQTGYLFDRKQGDQERLIRSSEALGRLLLKLACVPGLGRVGA
jgi:hypothetical protein